MTKNTNHCVKAYVWMCKSSVHVALRVHAGYSANCPGCFMLATLAVSSTTTYVALSPSCLSSRYVRYSQFRTCADGPIS